MNQKNSFINSVIFTLSGSSILMLGALITGSMTARLLGVEGRGEFAAIQLYGALIATLITLGIPSAITYFTGRNPSDAGSYYFTGIVIGLLLATFGSVLGYFLIPFLLSAQTSVITSAAQFYLLFVPLSIITGFSLATLQGQMKMFLWNILRIIAVIFWLIPLSYFFFFQNVNSVSLSKAYIIFLFLYSIIFVFILIRINWNSIKFRTELIRPMMKYAIPTHLATFSQQSNLRLDQILIAALLPAELLGIYVIALTWSHSYSPLANSASYVIVPHLTSLKNETHQANSLSKIARISLAINLFLAVIIIAITPQAIRIIFGLEFMSAVTISYILIIGSLIANMKTVFAEGLRGLGYPTIVMKGELIGLVISLILFPSLLKLYGLEGLAVASVIGYLATFLFYIICTSKKFKISLSESLKPKREDFTYIIGKLRNIFRINKKIDIKN